MTRGAVCLNSEALYEEIQDEAETRNQRDENGGKEENLGMEEVEKPDEARLPTGGIDTGPRIPSSVAFGVPTTGGRQIYLK
jgi:hypothetical protein